MKYSVAGRAHVCLCVHAKWLDDHQSSALMYFNDRQMPNIICGFCLNQQIQSNPDYLQKSIMLVFYTCILYPLESNIAWQPIQKSVSKVNHSLHASSSVLSFPLKIYFIYESKTTRLHSTPVKCFLQSSNLLSRLHQRLWLPHCLLGCIHPQLQVVNQNGEGRTTKMFPNYLLCNQRSESLCNQKHGL